MLSILVTYYNQEKFVSRSLDSIFSQKLSDDFEVLVGDDGSQDETCNIVNEYIKKYPGKIKLFIQPRDLTKKYSSIERVSNNRLDLLNKALGDYVIFLDGDDFYNDFLFMQEAIDSLSVDKKLIGVAHDFIEVYESGKQKVCSGMGNKTYITAKDYCKSLYTHVGTCVFRNVFKKTDYEKLKLLRSFDDNDITYYFLNFGNILYVKKYVYNYWQHEGSIWNEADAFERNLINAIDYEIIKKIIDKYHFQLFIKYFFNLYFVYKNKNKLQDLKFEKYKTQCIDNGIIKKFYNWSILSLKEKIKINISFIFEVFLFICIRCISKTKKIIFER